MRLLNALILFFLFTCIGACTKQGGTGNGSGSGGSYGPMSDAEGFFGKTPRNFIHVDSPTQATIVSVARDYLSARKSLYETTKGITDLGDLPMSQITFFQDKAALTILGSPYLFHLVELRLEEIKPTTLTTFDPSLEAVCISNPQNSSMGSSGFQEVQFKKQISGPPFKVYGLKDGVTEVLGDAWKQDHLPFQTMYQVTSFGDFIIDLNSPLEPESFYYKTSVTSPRLLTANNVYCHQSRRPTYSVFVTSTLHAGNFGGLAGADSICQTRALVGGLLGNWKAILSTSTVLAQDRLTILGPVRVLGSNALIASDKTSLWDGNLEAAINRTEFADEVPLGTYAWTGGDAVFPNNCSDWTTNSTGEDGSIGWAHGLDDRWFDFIKSLTAERACDEPQSLYCISQP